MKRLVLLFTLLICSSFCFAADQAPECGPGPDLNKVLHPSPGKAARIFRKK